LVLRTAKEVRATLPLLRRVPFVPLSTWNAVEVEGGTTCEVTLTFVPDPPGAAGGRRVRYRVDLSPHDTTVYVPSIDLRATAARGRVVIEDDLLTLSGVRGSAAGGELRVGSTMDFRTPGHSVMRFAVETSLV